MPSADPDAGDVQAQPGRPAGDGVGVEHRIAAEEFVRPFPATYRSRRTQDENGTLQPETGMCPGDRALRRRQPFDPDDAAGDGLPLRDEIPFTALAAMRAELIEARPGLTAAPSVGGSSPAPRAAVGRAPAPAQAAGTSRNGLFSTTAMIGSTSPSAARRSASHDTAISPPVECALITSSSCPSPTMKSTAQSISG